MKPPQPRVRELVGEALKSDADLDAFCSDHFPDVYRRFSDGMQRVRKVTLLLDHADHGRLLDLLVKQAPAPGSAGEGAQPALGGRIKVLFLAANPRSTTQLELGREARPIAERIRAARHRDALELVARWAVRPDERRSGSGAARPGCGRSRRSTPLGSR